jgi:hypothetical protein
VARVAIRLLHGRGPGNADFQIGSERPTERQLEFSVERQEAFRQLPSAEV